MSNYPPSRRDGTYFQIPLCAFAFGASDKERLDAISCFGVVEAGQKRWSNLAEPQRRALLNELTQAGKIPRDFRPRNPRHVRAVFGADMLNVRFGSVCDTLSMHDELLLFRESFERQHGTDVLGSAENRFGF